MDTQTDAQIKDAEKLNQESNDGWDDEWEEEDTLLNPSRWWFASTACPLIAGTFGPMANAFNLCALIEYWREYIPPGGREGHGTLVKDPTWLTVINAISFVTAIVANAALMANMFGRIRFSIAQPTTIAGYYLSSFILIALVGAANSESFRLTTVAPGSDRALGQAYYYACFAAALYFIMATLMGFTVYGAITGRYEKKFAITMSQRTLMMQTISFMVYLLGGAGIYTTLEPSWGFNDSVYWADFTLLTIGIGDDFVPTTHASRTLLLFYTFGGILAVGLVISSIRSMLLEKGAQKLHARTVEKKRQNVHSLHDAQWGRGHWWSAFFGRHKTPEPPTFETEREKREAEFQAMRRIQERTADFNRYRALAISSLNAAILWFIGALAFWYAERHLQNWSYFECLYFAFTTLITLGYGDFQPLSNAGKSFFVLWTLLAIPTLTVLISDMSDTVVKAISDLTNLLGSITTGDASYITLFRKRANKVSGGRMFSSYSSTVKKEERAEEEDDGRRGRVPHLLYNRLSKDEKIAMDDYAARTHESLNDRDIHFYHYILVKEIQAVLADTKSEPPKKYTYDEWAYYLKLLGHDEEDSAYHTDTYNKPKKDDEEGPQVGRILDHKGEPRHWAWLSLRSPLIGLGSEADWILKRLMTKLHSELRFQGKPGRGIGDHPPPFSISAIKGHSTGFSAHEHPSGLKGAELKQLESTFGS